MTDPTFGASSELPKDDERFPSEPAGRIASLRPHTASGSSLAQRETAVDTEPPWPSAPPSPGTPNGREIGRLTRVDASAIWVDDGALAGWLAANPDAIARVIGLPSVSFEPPDSQIVVGLAPDERRVCVVCETGPSTDESLGVLMRVAAVQDGGTVAWVSGDPAETHMAALSWLNRSTSPQFSFVRVSGVRVDESAPAPLFERLVRPRRAGDGTGAATIGPTDGPRRRADDHVTGA